MSYIEPPTLTNIRKRKRSARSASVASSIGSSRHHLPKDAIDPHSYGPSARRQLAVAGLSHSDQLPGDYLADFPHRPLPDEFGIDPKVKAMEHRRDAAAYNDYDDFDSDGDSANSQNSESGPNDMTEDESGEGDPAKIEARKQRKIRRREAKRRRNAIRTHRIHDQRIGMLMAIIQRGIQEGEHGTLAASAKSKDRQTGEAAAVGLAHAKRAYALLVRTEIRGKPVDLRRSYLWAMGAEILMREGEDTRAADREEQGVRRRWGAADNIPQVRAFYENLIQLHPYNRLWPRSIGALTFWPIMIGTELYSIYAEAQLQTERLAASNAGSEKWSKHDSSGSESDSDSDSGSDSDNDSDSDSDGGDRKSAGQRRKPSGDSEEQRAQHQRDHPTRLAREDIRLSALEQVRDIARRMDGVMANAPYLSSTEMLRLRGMVSLYMGDLFLVTLPCTDQEDEGGRRARAHERKKARGWFMRLMEIDKDIQSGRQLSKKKGGTGLPDTMN
ncbi:nadh-ubiquinone oxidoreductase [Ophiostoma piceae UAMH 11346]|uniref:Nadh-ubiquinone oxidoreductase n=1 Tax=Ophiostoma piceae (strain UAMH 11346) TaxID=1262450 RepID=S3BXS8_OPHP1|nr:nadh-ubiquinone oxidoreductase [Ophiostoma piceae UAMH 11346]